MTAYNILCLIGLDLSGMHDNNSDWADIDRPALALMRGRVYVDNNRQ